MKKSTYLHIRQHNAIPKLKAFALTLVLIVMISVQGWGQGVFTSKASAAWNLSTTWTLNSGTDADGIPDADDIVFILYNHNVTISDTRGAVSVAINTDKNDNSSQGLLIFGASGDLTVSGNVTMGGTGNRKGSINMSAGGFFRIGGNLSKNSTNSVFTKGTGTVVFNGALQAISNTDFTFNNLTFSGSGIKSITTSVITVDGTLSIEGSATTTIVPTYGTGAKLQYNTTTARNAGVEWITPFIATGGVVIANTGVITLNADKVMNSVAPLAVNSGATLTIPAVNILTVNSSIANTGTVNILSTSATQTGQLVAAASSGGGTYNVQRFIPSTDWSLVSSPVSGVARNAFAATGVNYTGTTPDRDYDLAPYVEATDIWTPFTLENNSTLMGVAEGYSVKTAPGTTVTFSGTGIYTGSQSVTITCGALTSGWNCIGNPYTSGLKSRYFLSVNRPNLDPLYTAVYRWEESSSTYVPINFTTSGADTIIAVGQGFFVNSKEVASNSASFTSAMQTSGAATFKSSEIPWPTIKLIAKAEGLSNVSTIAFNSEMTRGLDPGFDAGILRGNPNIALYTRLLEDNGIDFAIQALPEITTETVRIPVGIDFVPGGEMSFYAEITDFPVEASVYLEDMQTKTTTLLNAEGAKYTVTLPAETKGAGRFNLLVTKSATGIKTVTENLFNVYTNGNTITINGPAASDTQFELYSIDGKQWMSRRAGNMNQNTIDASSFPAGIYMLKISHQGTRIAKKLILTK